MKTEKREIKRIGVVSVVKILALLGLVTSLISIIYLSLLKFLPTVAAQMGIDSNTITVASIASVPLLIVGYYVLLGLIIVALYNLFAKWIGGIKVDLN